MRSIQILSCAVALANNVYSQAASSAKCDAVTKICFSSYTVASNGITFGIALPMDVTTAYDAVISITAPIATAWVGFAWGGTMVFDPMTAAWPNGKSGTVSARFAFGHGFPLGYDGAEHTLLKGTTSNSTHWTVVAKCSGCTSWEGSDANTVLLNGTGTTTFAWAQGTTAVAEPANNASTFSVHKAIGFWEHDLNAARSSSFSSWVSSNALTSVATTSVAAPTTATTLSTATVKPTVAPIKNAAIPASCSGAGSASFSSVLASGWKATKVLGGLTSPRSLVWDSAGNLLMVQSGKGISYHTMSADGCIASTKMLVSLNSLNHGIAMSVDGKTLYASSMTTVFSWPYTASTGTVGTRATIITGMYSGGSHVSRTLLIGAHAPNLLVVSHGSNANLDTAASNPKTARAIVKVFDLTTIPAAGVNYASGGWNAGYGLRNEIGITFDGNNMMWGVENSADDFSRGGKDIHQNNPAEKLNYLGDITKPNDQWYGYPTCFAVWQASDFTNGLKVGEQFVLTPNSTFDDSTCKTKSVPPALVMQAHSAPIDSKFDSTYSNLFVSFHGSWNRNPTTGFKLVAIPFTKGADGSYKPTAPTTSTTGYVDIMSNPDVTKCAGNGPVMSSGCFRPAGLLFDAGGRLYMTSDLSSNAELWVLGKA